MKKRRKNINKPTHVTRGNVFDDLGFEEPELSIVKMKADIHIAIMTIVEKHQYKSRDLEKILDIPQPRVSELLNGKVSKFSLELLSKYLHRLGAKPMIRVDFGNALKDRSFQKMAGPG